MERDVDNADGAVHAAPPPGIVGTVFVALFAISLVVGIIATGGKSFPTPDTPLDQLQDYYKNYPEVVRWTAFLQFGASIPLGIYAATMVSRLFFHRIRVAGVDIARFGGFASAILLGISALSAWPLSNAEVSGNSATNRSLELFGFVTGGVGHAVTLGLLIAGLSVPCLFYRLMPRWMPWAGLIIAAICELSFFSLVFPPLYFLIPLGRLPGYIWMIIAGFTVPGRRKRPTRTIPQPAGVQ